MADLHAHNWSAFSKVDEKGVNSRLAALLSELSRCAEETKKAGGDMMIIAGDIFHVRGSIAPSVLNPVMDALRAIRQKGLGNIVILAGNHDLEGKESDRVSSAITALEGAGCKVVNSTHTGLEALERVVLIPWIPKIEDLKAAITAAALADTNPREVDLIIHAPVDGVIEGLPDHGLSPEWLAQTGFRRVFSGHYHHHKLLYDGETGTYGTDVYSIGAVAHHTWSDVNSKAGFLIVSDAGVKWFKSHTPEFIEISGETDPSEIPLIVDGNFVRAKISSSKQSEVEELRSYLMDSGAAGVVLISQKESSVTARTGSTVKSGTSVEMSVGEFIKAQSYANPEELARLCAGILSDARSVEV
jgi:DNA repair exonuclease SbcCD nuclease subunit